MGRPRHRLQIAQKNHRRNENGQGNRTFPKVRPFPLSGEENPKYLLHQLKRAPVLPRVKGPIRIRNLPRPSRRRRMTCSLPGTETLRTHISLYPASMILCNKNEGLANEKPAEGWKNLGMRPISPNGLTEVGAASADWPRPDNVMAIPNSSPNSSQWSELDTVLGERKPPHQDPALTATLVAASSCNNPHAGTFRTLDKVPGACGASDNTLTAFIFVFLGTPLVYGDITSVKRATFRAKADRAFLLLRHGFLPSMS